jgi:hypothetical protein
MTQDVKICHKNLSILDIRDAICGEWSYLNATIVANANMLLDITTLEVF